jgi:hypothetical protein
MVEHKPQVHVRLTTREAIGVGSDYSVWQGSRAFAVAVMSGEMLTPAERKGIFAE